MFNDLFVASHYRFYTSLQQCYVLDQVSVWVSDKFFILYIQWSLSQNKLIEKMVDFAFFLSQIKILTTDLVWRWVQECTYIQVSAKT